MFIHSCTRFVPSCCTAVHVHILPPPISDPCVGSSLDLLERGRLLEHALVRSHARVEVAGADDALAHMLPFGLAAQQLHRLDGGAPSLELAHPVADLPPITAKNNRCSHT